MRTSSKWIQYIIMKQDVLCNENTVVKLLVRVLQDPHWEHFVRIRLQAHPGNTWYNRNEAARGQKEKTFYPVSFYLVKGGQEWQTHVCMCGNGLRSNKSEQDSAQSTLTPVQRHLQCLPSEALQGFTHCLKGCRNWKTMSLTYPERCSYHREAWKQLVARAYRVDNHSIWKYGVNFSIYKSFFLIWFWKMNKCPLIFFNNHNSKF